MVAPVVMGAMIGAGASLLGGYLNRESQEEQVRRNEELQREFAQSGIRWRVADAKAAGIHPLYALGATGQSYTPSPIVSDGLAEGLANAGQNVGRAVAAQETPSQRLMAEAQLANLAATAENQSAQAAYWRSQAALRSGPQVGAPMADEGFSMPEYQGVEQIWRHASGKVGMSSFPLPAIDPYENQGVAKAPTAGWSTYTMAPGLGPFNKGPLRIDLPSSEEGLAESVEGISTWMWPAIAAHNLRRYGADWWVYWRDKIPGLSMLGDEYVANLLDSMGIKFNFEGR